MPCVRSRTLVGVDDLEVLLQHFKPASGRRTEGIVRGF
jgi:hypothetical protein